MISQILIQSSLGLHRKALIMSLLNNFNRSQIISYQAILGRDEISGISRHSISQFQTDPFQEVNVRLVRENAISSIRTFDDSTFIVDNPFQDAQIRTFEYSAYCASSTHKTDKPQTDLTDQTNLFLEKLYSLNKKETLMVSSGQISEPSLGIRGLMVLDRTEASAIPEMVKQLNSEGFKIETITDRSEHLHVPITGDEMLMSDRLDIILRYLDTIIKSERNSGFVPDRHHAFCRSRIFSWFKNDSFSE